MKYKQQLENLKQSVIELSKNPDFIHHKWFIEYHLEIVEKIAMETCDIYSNANRDVVYAMVWMHDYGKIIDFDNQYSTTLSLGEEFMKKHNLPEDFCKTVIGYIDIMDKKLSIDISKTALEIQIISSSDGASHFVGPFLDLWWYENSTKDYKELMADNMYKIEKDWNRKVVIPEIRKAFEARYLFLREKSGEIGNTFL